MRFSNDLAAPLVQVQWYFVDDVPSALPQPLPMPFYSAFASGNWAEFKDGDYWFPGPGESTPDPARRAWVNGARPPAAVGLTGRSGPCGSADLWRNGVPWPWTPLPPAPPCCSGPPNFGPMPNGPGIAALVPVLADMARLTAQGFLSPRFVPAVLFRASAAFVPSYSAPTSVHAAAGLSPDPASLVVSAVDMSFRPSLPLAVGNRAKAGFNFQAYRIPLVTPSGGCGSLPQDLLVQLASDPPCKFDGNYVLPFNFFSGADWEYDFTDPTWGPLTVSLSCTGGNWNFRFGPPSGIGWAMTTAVGPDGYSCRLVLQPSAGWGGGPCAGSLFGGLITGTS